ncbi:MAG TPA: BLUF domain-containing protein [Burkholderiaceae bacterium]
MRAIAYVSSSAWSLSDDDLRSIVAESRGRNVESGVTGVLLYCDGNFMQYLEGPDEALLPTYQRIRASTRHHRLNELINQPVSGREFGDWALGFARKRPEDFLRAWAPPWGLERRGGPGAAVMSKFWANCHRLPA